MPIAANVIKVPDLEFSTLRSPFKRPLGKRYEELLADVAQKYADLKDASILPFQEMSKLVTQVDAVLEIQATGLGMEPVTRDDALLKMHYMSDARIKYLEVRKNIRDSYAEELKNSTKIYVATLTLNDYALKVTRKPSFFSSDRTAIAKANRKASTWLAINCPDLEGASKLAELDFKMDMGVMSLGAMLNIMDDQAARPNIFGRAYQDQPVI